MNRGAVVTVEGLGQRVTVRGYIGFGGYTEKALTLLLDRGQVVLEGENISLEAMGEGELVAVGHITALRYEGRGA